MWLLGTDELFFGKNIHKGQLSKQQHNFGYHFSGGITNLKIIAYSIVSSMTTHHGSFHHNHNPYMYKIYAQKYYFFVFFHRDITMQ